MNKILKNAYTVLFASVCVVSVPLSGWSQTQASGSTNVENSSRSIGYSRTTDAESLFIGPSANISIASGATWDIYSKNVWISPSATISGPGTIIIHNSADISGVGGRTLIDANNGNYITANVKVINNNGIQLQTVARPADLGSWSGDASSTLKIGATLDLAVDGANVWLGGVLPSDASAGNIGDLNLNANGTLSASGGSLGAQRMVVTNNSTLSHLVKDQSSNNPFVYPVGIAAGDYTPATIAGGGTYNVSVIDYTQGGTNPVINVPAEGMYRTWHIFGGAASSITLQHNAGTNGASYIDASGFIVRYDGGGNWLQPYYANEYVSPGVHKDQVFGSAIPASGSNNWSYYTKSSDRSTPLPVTMQPLTAEAVGTAQVRLGWKTVSEANNAGFVILHSMDNKRWDSIGYTKTLAEGGNSSALLSYSFLDGSPALGTNYYRLKQVDNDHSFTYSTTVSIQLGMVSDDPKLYPNPAVSMVTIANVPLGSQLRVIGMDGKVYMTQTVNSVPQTLNVSQLVTGMYLVQVFKDNTLLKTIKMWKK